MFLVVFFFFENVVLLQMVMQRSQLNSHAFYTWIHLKEVTLDSRTSFKGKSISRGMVDLLLLFDLCIIVFTIEGSR